MLFLASLWPGLALGTCGDFLRGARPPLEDEKMTAPFQTGLGSSTPSISRVAGVTQGALTSQESQGAQAGASPTLHGVWVDSLGFLGKHGHQKEPLGRIEFLFPLDSCLSTSPEGKEKGKEKALAWGAHL